MAAFLRRLTTSPAVSIATSRIPLSPAASRIPLIVTLRMSGTNVSGLAHWKVLFNDNTQRICKEFGDHGEYSCNYLLAKPSN